MATYSLDQIIDKTLYAEKNLTGYYGYPNSDRIRFVPKGTALKLYSWVRDKKNKAVYLMFNDLDKTTGQTKPFYVLDAVGYFSLDPVQKQQIKSKEQQVEEIKEQQEKESKGNFIYYLEKYGKKVLIGSAITVIIYGLATHAIDRNKKNG